MNPQDLTLKFSVNKSASEIFHAVNNVQAWWAEGIEGDTEKLDSAFLFVHENIHRSIQKVIELVPDQKIVWLITDAYLSFVPNKTEWIGTKIIFEIVENEQETTLVFTHQGLVPAFECFNNCSNAWTFLITDSLKNLILTGKGKPILKPIKN